MRYIVEVLGREIGVEILEEGGRTWAVIGGKRLPVELQCRGHSGLYTLLLGERSLTLWLEGEGTGYRVQLAGRSYTLELERFELRRLRARLRRTQLSDVATETITAHMPGLIAKVEVREGQAVQRGEVMLVVEAMKMENEIRSPCDGVVEQVAVEAGREVSRGQLLCVIRKEMLKRGDSHG
jgi:biotin carboxyl carrier protein